MISSTQVHPPSTLISILSMLLKSNISPSQYQEHHGRFLTFYFLPKSCCPFLIHACVGFTLLRNALCLPAVRLHIFSNFQVAIYLTPVNTNHSEEHGIKAAGSIHQEVGCGADILHPGLCPHSTVTLHSQHLPI